MKQIACKILKLYELRPLLGLSILDMTPEEQEATIASMFPNEQLTLFDYPF